MLDFPGSLTYHVRLQTEVELTMLSAFHTYHVRLPPEKIKLSMLDLPGSLTSL